LMMDLMVASGTESISQEDCTV